MINFSFDGKTYQAQKGDTLAAALLRNGIGLVGRSHLRRSALRGGADGGGGHGRSEGVCISVRHECQKLEPSIDVVEKG